MMCHSDLIHFYNDFYYMLLINKICLLHHSVILSNAELDLLIFLTLVIDGHVIKLSHYWLHQYHSNDQTNVFVSIATGHITLIVQL